MPKIAKKPVSERARKARRTRRIRLLREARAIIALAAITRVGEKPHYEAPNYYVIAAQLGLPKKAADAADEYYGAVNGPDEWTPKCEENAMERVEDLLRMELES